jgi:hypothetical protein
VGGLLALGGTVAGAIKGTILRPYKDILAIRTSARGALHRTIAGSVQGLLAVGARLRWASYAQVGSVERRFVFVFGIGVRYTMFFEALALAIHLIKNTLAE